MTDIAIRVQSISKQYRIGGKLDEHKTLRESLTQGFTGVFRLLSSVARGRPVAAAKETIWALKDVSFEVKRGEVVGIVGRNGAGKSTLLKILSRITEPTEGYAEVSGRVGSLLEVGTGFHPELTGRENIYLNSAILGMRRREIERKFDEIVAFAEIEKFIDTPVKRYSSGMYVRLAFAVAAHLGAEILFVDEVLAVGDAAFQKKCLGKMGDVASEGRTVLFVSHNLASIQGLCEKCILLEEGRMVRSGETRGVIDYYLQTLTPALTESTSGAFDLSQRKNDYTPGVLMVQKVCLRDQKGNLQNQFRMGERFQTEILVEGISRIENCVIGLTIKTKDDFWVGSLNTAMGGFHLEESSNETQKLVSCEIDELPLNPGRYVLAVSVVRARRRVDYVERAAVFDVIERDVYGTGYPMEAKYGVVCLKGKWRIAQA